MTTEFTFSSAIRGFHVYRHSWIPHVGEQLETEREPNNTEDRFAVAVIKVGQNGSRTVVGHIPRELSSLLFHFLAHGGDISCEVTGPRKRSPLSQGGLEIPCYLTLRGKKKLIAKAETLVSQVLATKDNTSTRSAQP